MSNSTRPRRPLPRPATVLAAIAVFAVLAGTATAAGGLINGSSIKKGTITGKQIKNRSLAISKLSKAAVGQLRGQRGASGERGATGPQGPAGIVAPLAGAQTSGKNIADGEEVVVLTVPVATAGTFVINAKANLFALQATAKVECFLRADGKAVDLVQWTAGAVNSRQSVSMVALAGATPANPLQVICAFDEGNGSVSETHLTAIPVS